jgi:hypothetical protein
LAVWDRPPRVISTIPYGGEKQAKELLRFFEWPQTAITAALYRNPPNPLQNQNPLSGPFVPKDSPAREHGLFFGKLWALEGPITPFSEGGGSEY